MSQSLKRITSPNDSSQPKRTCHIYGGDDSSGMDDIEMIEVPDISDPTLVTMSEVNSFAGCTDIISSISFHKSNTRYATGGMDKFLLLYDWTSYLERNHTSPPSAIWRVFTRSKVSSVLFSTDSDELFAGCYDGVVKSFAIESNMNKPTEISSFPGRVWSIDSHEEQPDLLASASHDGTAAVMDRRIPLKTARVVIRLRMMDTTTCVKFRKPTELCVTCADQSVRLYDIRNSCRPVLRFNRSCHDRAVSYVSLSGEHIISAGLDSKVCCWSEEGDCVREYTSHKNHRNFTGLSSTSDLIAVGSEDNRLYLYDKKISLPVSSSVLYSPLPHTFVSSVTFDRSGKYLLCANSAGFVTIMQIDGDN